MLGRVSHKTSLPDEDLILWDNVVPTCETGYEHLNKLYSTGSFIIPVPIGGVIHYLVQIVSLMGSQSKLY